VDKKQILERLEAQVSATLTTLKNAARSAHEAATHAESKAEDQYDTRGLEAAYLAGAQSKRVAELEELLALFRFVDLRPFGEGIPIASTALVELLNEQGVRSTFFLMPKGGGMQVSMLGKTIQVITPQSPLGEALLGRRVGESVQVEINGVTKEFEITALW
jgi:transcription elongation GreA/GreB family factor